MACEFKKQGIKMYRLMKCSGSKDLYLLGKNTASGRVIFTDKIEDATLFSEASVNYAMDSVEDPNDQLCMEEVMVGVE